MNTDEIIKVFNESYPELTKEEENLTEQIVSIFEKKLDNIRPIMKVMKESNLYFFHPDLADNLKTTHGVIIGRNRKNNAEIFVFPGNNQFVSKVDAYNDKVLEVAAMTLKMFFRYSDLNFAIRGIEHIENYLPNVLEISKKKIDEKKRFIQEHGTQSPNEYA